MSFFLRTVMENKFNNPKAKYYIYYYNFSLCNFICNFITNAVSIFYQHRTFSLCRLAISLRTQFRFVVLWSKHTVDPSMMMILISIVFPRVFAVGNHKIVSTHSFIT